MDHRPYHYARWMVIIQHREPIIAPNYPSQIPFWISLRGLPLHYWDKAMLHRIGNELGHFDGFELTSVAARVRVTIDGLKPLIKETIVEFDSGEETIVSLECEKLANHCQLCNSLLHDEHQCQIQSDQESYLQKPESSNKLQKDEIKLHPTAPRTSWQQKTSLCPLTKEQESNISEKRHYSQRLDRHGRPFGTRPSEKTTTPAYGSKPLNASPRYRIKETPRTHKSRSPTDSHSYQRQRNPSAPRQDITTRNTSLVNQLRVDSRRRSLSFGTRTNGENLMW